MQRLFNNSKLSLGALFFPPGGNANKQLLVAAAVNVPATATALFVPQAHETLTHTCT